MTYADQNAPIYSDDPFEEEMMIEWNSRYDYISELRAEFADCGDEDYADDHQHVPFLRGCAFWQGCVACGAADGLPF